MKKTMQIGSATVTVVRPELTEEERKVREAAVIAGLKRYGRALQKKEEKERAG